MSSDKSDEFSLDGLDDLDLSENEEVANVPVEEDGFEFDLSDGADDFSLSEDGEGVINEEVPAPNEFSLTNVNINIDLAEGEDIPSEEVQPGDLIDLGDEEKEEFHLDEASDDFSDLSEPDLGALDESDLASFNFEENEDLTEDPSMTRTESDASEDDELLDPSLNEGDFLSTASEDSSEDIEESEATLNDPLKDYSSPQIQLAPEDLTAEARAKLEEIDAIMREDATRGHMLPSDESFESSEPDLSFNSTADEAEEINTDEMFTSAFEEGELEASVDKSLVGDINLSDLDLSEEREEDDITSVIKLKSPPVQEAAPAPTKKKKKKESSDSVQHLEDISVAYTGEMERTQATIANLRADRDELLKRIDHLEEEKLLGQRNALNLRAELDEKKIELTIIRKKLNEEINDLKDRLSIYEEKILVLEERNKQLQQELDNAGQKNRIDVKRIMLRERELEQKLELLKADAETQIRNRDLKILELKRKIDAMEFDMESISQQEKKTLESRFELEDKLDKAIRTLRSAISTLEEDGNRSATLEAIKKNIEM